MGKAIGIMMSLLFVGFSAHSQYLSYSDYMDEVAEIANRIQLGENTSYQIGGTNVSDTCVSFLTKEMFLGDSGRHIYEAFNQNIASFPELVKGGNISKYCSKYPQMKSNQKGMVWVMVLTMMAHFESSCSIKARAKGPNGTAKGFYQLHQGKEANYDKLGMCAKNSSTSDKLSSKCALSMLERQMSRENGDLFSKKSYWDVLRPNGAARKADDIQRTLKKSSLCNPMTL